MVFPDPRQLGFRLIRQGGGRLVGARKSQDFHGPIAMQHDQAAALAADSDFSASFEA
jgi:hypothetical protein